MKNFLAQWKSSFSLSIVANTQKNISVNVILNHTQKNQKKTKHILREDF